MSAAFLSGLGDALVDFHGQNEHQSLMKPSVQLELLDRYGRLEKERGLRGGVRRAPPAVRAAGRRLHDRRRTRPPPRLGFVPAQRDRVGGIERGEEGELQTLYPRLKNANRLCTLSSRAYELLSAGESPALAGLEKAEGPGSPGGNGRKRRAARENLSQAVLALKDIEEALYKYTRTWTPIPPAWTRSWPNWTKYPG